MFSLDFAGSRMMDVARERGLKLKSEDRGHRRSPISAASFSTRFDHFLTPRRSARLPSHFIYKDTNQTRNLSLRKTSEISSSPLLEKQELDLLLSSHASPSCCSQTTTPTTLQTLLQHDYPFPSYRSQQVRVLSASLLVADLLSV